MRKSSFLEDDCRITKFSGMTQGVVKIHGTGQDSFRSRTQFLKLGQIGKLPKPASGNKLFV
jgi:hypothetical protein